MALIEFTGDLKRTNELLDRLARAAELFLLAQYQIRTGSTVGAMPDPSPREKESVDYASDEATLKDQLERLHAAVEDDGEESAVLYDLGLDG